MTAPSAVIGLVVVAFDVALAGTLSTTTTSYWSLLASIAHIAPAVHLHHFFPRLAPGGVYIIEDVETNYWAFGRKESVLYQYKWNMGDEQLTSDVVGLFREAVDRVVMREFMCTRALPPVFTREVDAQIATVAFIHNAIIVMKRTSQMHTPAPHYRFRYQQDCGGPLQHPRTGPQVAALEAPRGIRAAGPALGPAGRVTVARDEIAGSRG